MNRICRILIKITLCVFWVRVFSSLSSWIRTYLSNLINGFLTIVAIPPGLAFLLGLEVSVTPSLPFLSPKSIFFILLLFLYNFCPSSSGRISIRRLRDIHHLVFRARFCWDWFLFFNFKIFFICILSLKFLHLSFFLKY